jgi:hypothetical protein
LLNLLIFSILLLKIGKIIKVTIKIETFAANSNIYRLAYQTANIWTVSLNFKVILIQINIIKSLL